MKEVFPNYFCKNWLIFQIQIFKCSSKTSNQKTNNPIVGKYTKRPFPIKDTNVRNKNLKLCPTVWAIREMKIKTTLKDHHASMRVFNIPTHHQVLTRMYSKETIWFLVVVCKMYIPSETELSVCLLLFKIVHTNAT